jgi:hypothetical protein
MGCYWEHIEKLRNVLRTRHEHLGNFMGTYWAQGKKYSPPPSSKTQKEKKLP